jgi:hypothetical protein
MAIFVCLQIVITYFWQNLKLLKFVCSKVNLQAAAQQHVKDFFATNLSRVQILIPLWVWKKPRYRYAEGPGWVRSNVIINPYHLPKKPSNFWSSRRQVVLSFCDWQNGDLPQEELAKFGYSSQIKVEKFKKPRIVWWLAETPLSKYGKFKLLFPLKIWRRRHSFSTKKTLCCTLSPNCFSENLSEFLNFKSTSKFALIHLNITVFFTNSDFVVLVK